MKKEWMLAVVVLTGACALEEQTVQDWPATQARVSPEHRDDDRDDDDRDDDDRDDDDRDDDRDDDDRDDDRDDVPPAACEPAPDAVVIPPAPENLPDVALTTQERLGQLLFFDRSLSTPEGQACAVCHLGETGWTGPDEGFNQTGSVYEGAVAGFFGNRKPPSSAYATRAPIFNLYSIDDELLFAGGNFWDGRATGRELGNPAADQAQGPFVNPVEQANPDEQTTCLRVRSSRYAFEQTGRTYEELFEEVYGPGSLDCEGDVARTYDLIAISIAVWEGSCQVNEYSSKYDAFLLGQARLTRQERRGLRLFEGKAMCSNCHLSRPGPDGMPPLFTDFTFDNLGVPKNPCNPWYEQILFNPLGADWLDMGLGLNPYLLERQSV